MGATNAGMHELTVIVDHNKIQSDHWVSSTSDLGRLDERFKSFGWNVLRCDGHDTGQFSLAVKETDTSDKPSVIIADTIKGFGVSYLQPTALGDRDFYQFLCYFAIKYSSKLFKYYRFAGPNEHKFC